MANVFYKQCRLVRKTVGGRTEKTCWIPERFANLDSTVKIKNDDGTWTDGWIVKSASETRLEEKHLPDSHSMIKGHRHATGDSRPK